MTKARVFLTVKEVANLLKLNILTVYQYVRSGKLQAVKLGRNYRIEEKDLDAFIKAHQVLKKSRQYNSCIFITARLPTHDKNILHRSGF